MIVASSRLARPPKDMKRIEGKNGNRERVLRHKLFDSLLCTSCYYSYTTLSTLPSVTN